MRRRHEWTCPFCAAINHVDDAECQFCDEHHSDCTCGECEPEPRPGAPKWEAVRRFLKRQ